MNRTHRDALVARVRARGGVLPAADADAIMGRSGAIGVLLRSGAWQEVLPGVLAPAGVDITSTLRERASTFWAPGSALGLFSAARKNAIWVPDRAGVWITTPFASEVRSREGIKVFRTRRMPMHLETDGYVHWTTAPRSVLDLATELTPKQFDAVLLNGIRNGTLTAAEVDAEASLLRGRKGIAMARAATALWTPERETMLEGYLYADVCAVHPADEVQRQYVIRRPDGGGWSRFDMAIESLMLAFEADGLFFHSTDAQIAADQHRDRMYLGLGWQTVRYREGPISDHARVQREVRAIIERRRRQLRIA